MPKRTKRSQKRQRRRRQTALPPQPSSFSAFNPPMIQPVKLNFVTNFQLVLLNTDNRALFPVYVNDWYQPIGSSRQPNYYDFWAANYQHYVAQSCKMLLRYGGSNSVPMTIGVVTWPDIGVSIPNAPGIISLLSQYPKAKTKIMGATPCTSCVGEISYYDPMVDMYARFPGTNSNQFQMKVKAPTNAAHPYPMQYMVFLSPLNGSTPTVTQTVQVQIEMTYEGYFTDRSNSYES